MHKGGPNDKANVSVSHAKTKTFKDHSPAVKSEMVLSGIDGQENLSDKQRMVGQNEVTYEDLDDIEEKDLDKYEEKPMS